MNLENERRERRQNNKGKRHDTSYLERQLRQVTGQISSFNEHKWQTLTIYLVRKKERKEEWKEDVEEG